MEMKFYSPLTAEFFPDEPDWEDESYNEYEGYPMDGHDLLQYADAVDEAVKKDIADFNGDLMQYYHEDDSVRSKVVSAVPSAEICGNKLCGCLTVELKEALLDDEQTVLCNYISGQYSDGWGEGFEQRDIRVEDGTLAVHFWQEDGFKMTPTFEKTQEQVQMTQRPKMKLLGEDGNIFAIMGRASLLLKNAGQSDKAKDKHGKFAFPYGRIIGYRKGANGKPEIIPEQAEIIRLIFNRYLQGDSLQSIKAKLETAGALTARGNTAWSAQSIQRILQNEKYCGDVLLQKTFTEDVLTGVHKKNTGQLPQYYIENYHEGIVSKQMFREVQAEIARRNSKSAANQRKRRRGRYNSKYALSERLFCGNCGSPYKRVTWNIHGRKQIVWRCVNRIEYGTKFCSSSPSVPEEELHRAILKAVQDLAANFTDEVATQINGILHDIQTGESTMPNLQEQLEQTQQEFDRLLEMSLDFDEDTPFLDNRLKKLNNKIKSLKKAIEDSAARQEKARQPEMLLSAKDLQIQEYDDALTARIIEKITVRSRNEIEIRFIGGYEKVIPLV